MLQLFFAVAFSAVPLTLYVPPVRSLNLFVESLETIVRHTIVYTSRAYPRVRYGCSRILASLRRIRSSGDDKSSPQDCETLPPSSPSQRQRQKWHRSSSTTTCSSSDLIPSCRRRFLRELQQQRVPLVDGDFSEIPNISLSLVKIKIIVLEDTKEYISYTPKEETEAQDRHPFDLLVILNPKLTKKNNKIALFFEGCLRKMTGIEYMLYEVMEPHLFVIRKQKRDSPEKVSPMLTYYVLDGSIYQAPQLCNVFGARIRKLPTLSASSAPALLDILKAADKYEVASYSRM